MRPPAASASGEMDMNSFQKLLAPKDVVQVSFERKDNFHGIGYSGLDPTSAIFGGLNESTSFKPTGREKKGIKGQVCGNIFVFVTKSHFSYCCYFMLGCSPGARVVVGGGARVVELLGVILRDER